MLWKTIVGRQNQYKLNLRFFARWLHTNISLRRKFRPHTLHLNVYFALVLTWACCTSLSHTDTGSAQAHALRVALPVLKEWCLYYGQSKWNENRQNMTMLTWKGGLSNSQETWKTLLSLSLSLSSASFCLLSTFPPHSLSPLPPFSVSLLYIQTQTVNANKAFSHTELMYPVHFTNVLPFKCHLLCCCCEYILSTMH